MIVFTDKVLAEIGAELAAHEPERGGALLGLPYSNVVCHFVRDPEAQTSGASYLPSRGLTDAVQAYERAFGLQFFGIVHSHPGGYDQPSSQDHNAFSNSLRVNTHLSAFVAPIVTLDRVAAKERLNEISLPPQGRLTLYTAYRAKQPAIHLTSRDRNAVLAESGDTWRSERSSSPVTVVPTDCSIMPIAEHTSALVDGLRRNSVEVRMESGFLPINGSVFQTETLQGDGFELILLFPPTYPVSSPSILFTATKAVGSANTYEIKIDWPFGGGERPAVFDAINEAVLAAIRAAHTDLPGAAAGVASQGTDHGSLTEGQESLGAFS
jgi:proteasome lid subunit RPN8/RPN11